MLRILRNILLVVAALFLVLLAYVGIELARGPVESTPERVALEMPVGRGGPEPPPGDTGEAAGDLAEGADAAEVEVEETGAAEATTDSDEASAELPEAPAPPPIEGPPLRVMISLEEGEFRIRRGGVGGVVRVEGTYDSAVYELRQEFDPEGAEGGLVRVKLRRHISAVRALLTGLRAGEPENRLTVELPAGVPLDLSLNLSKGEHDVDLTGLAVARLDMNASIGEFEMMVGKPNPIEMSEAVIVARMGEFQMRGLGDADVRHLSYTGKMGDHLVDFGGVSRGDTTAEIQISMGSGRVNVPRNRDFEIDRRSVFLGEFTVRSSGIELGPEDRPPDGLLTLDLSVRMGEMVLR
jgi:hypothetical protein